MSCARRLLLFLFAFLILTHDNAQAVYPDCNLTHALRETIPNEVRQWREARLEKFREKVKPYNEAIQVPYDITRSPEEQFSNLFSELEAVRGQVYHD